MTRELRRIMRGHGSPYSEGILEARTMMRKTRSTRSVSTPLCPPVMRSEIETKTSTRSETSQPSP